MSEDTLALSRLVVDTFGGGVLGSPSEVAGTAATSLRRRRAG
jgi:hypothetical protein